MNGIRMASVVAACAALLLSVLLLSGDEPCEGADGIGLSAECRAQYETEANAGNVALMWRLSVYEGSHGDNGKSIALLRKAAFGGFERAQVEALGYCENGAWFSRKEVADFASKLKKSSDSTALVAVIDYYLDKECGPLDLKSVWEVGDSGNLKPDDACFIGVQLFERVETEMTISDIGKGRSLLKFCMDHATGRQNNFKAASEMYNKTRPD